MNPTTSRGYRNRNPGNIRHAPGVTWQGQSEDQSDDTEFVQFDSPEWGIRAIARVLITYQDKRKAADGSKIDTVREFIERWAPPNENNTRAYADHVAALMRVGDTAVIDVYRYETMKALVEAIITHELGGQPYPEAVINAGLVLAGIKPENAPDPHRSVLATKEGKIGVSMVVSGIIAAGPDLVEIGKTMEPFGSKIPYVGLLASALIMIGGVCVVLLKRRSINRAVP